MYLLKYHTQTDFYVIFHSRGELYSRTALDSLTRAVREGSLLGSRERAILVLIPYTSVADGLLDTDACGSIDVSATAGLLGDACEANGTDAYEYLLGILSCVPKPVWIKRMTQLCNGDVVLGEVSSGGQWERGYPFVSLLQAFKSPHRDTLMAWEPGWQARQSPELMAQWYALYREKMRESIAADNLAAATHDKDYWQKDARSVMLRPSYITDTTVVQAYTAYHYEFSISPLGATVTAAYNPELNSDHLYNGLVSMELIDQIAYRTVDVLGFIPFVDVWAEGAGAVYALVRGDAQRALLLGASVVVIKNFDAFLKAGGKGPAQVVAKYTDEGIEYVAKEVDDAIDDAFEAVRLELDVHDPEIARRAAGGGPYNGHHHPADALYANRHGAIYEGVGRDVAKAKLITGDIADHCPLLLANPQLVTRELSEVLAGMPDATKRKAFLEALDGFGDIEKLTTFVDDLANAPELVVALKGRWELVRAWEAFKDSPDLRTNIPLLTYTSDNFDELASIKRSLLEVSDQDALIANLNDRPFAHTPTSGAVVYSHLEHGTYLIGGFPSDLQHILDQLGYPKMDPLDLSFPIPDGQRFNLLNVSDDVYETYVNANIGFFRSVNGPWIDHGVSQGVPIIAVSDVTNPDFALYKYVTKEIDGVQVQVRELTGFGKEVHRLEWIHGYRYDVSTRRMLPPGESDGLPRLTEFDDYDHGL